MAAKKRALVLVGLGMLLTIPAPFAVGWFTEHYPLSPKVEARLFLGSLLWMYAGIFAAGHYYIAPSIEAFAQRYNWMRLRRAAAPVLSFVAGVLLVIVLWSWSTLTATLTEQETIASNSDETSSIGERIEENRRALLVFVESRVEPAFELASELAEAVVKLDTDELSQAVARSHLVAEASGSRNTALSVLRNLQAGSASEVTCHLLRRYGEMVEWTARLGRRDGYDFNSARYQSWLRADKELRDAHITISSMPDHAVLKSCDGFDPTFRVAAS